MTTKEPLDKKKGNKSLKDVVIDGKYRVLERLGGGSFGEVYMGRHLQSGARVAVKAEEANRQSRAMAEHRIYRNFNECLLAVGFPQVYFGGRVGGHNVIVMDFLGPNLEQIFSVCERKFDVKTVCMIGIQIIQRIQCMHSMHYVHRDIKPENFVMGVGDNSQTVYIIDMGLAKLYQDPLTMHHIPWEEKKSLTGTARYVSINAHRGIQQSRRDDMESIMYLLSYFLRGNLPWQGMKPQPNDYHYMRICGMKVATSSQMLLGAYPKQFAILLDYTRSLKFDEDPNYSFYLQSLHDVLTSRGETFDYQYSWLAIFDRHGRGERGDGDSVNDESLEEALPPTARPHHRQSCTDTTVYNTFAEDHFEDNVFGEVNPNKLFKKMQQSYGIDFFC